MPSILNGSLSSRLLRAAGHARPSPVQGLLEEWLREALVLPEDWEALPAAAQQEILASPDAETVLSRLVANGLLTEYQAGRISAGTVFGLVLGNYRILDRLGAGGMAVVFRAEHLDLRHRVAIKVLPLGCCEDSRLESRFATEMRAVARLHHPNIVAALDAGTVASPTPEGPVLRYFVMEYVPGPDLEEYVNRHGPLAPAHACSVIHQVAGALAETHRYDLVHRDIKPSNILVTPEGQAKLLDFGLARQYPGRLTQPGALLGTLDYMAPEQARDASSVDIRADLYALGGTLFWCLTGRLPFTDDGPVSERLVRRMTERPPAVRQYRPEVPRELDAVVARLLATDPADRFATPQDVMRALVPFLKPETGEHAPVLPEVLAARQPLTRDNTTGTPRRHRILIADDEDGVRLLCRSLLQAEGLQCDEAPDGLAALEAASRAAYDLVLLDVDMPGLTGPNVLRRLREAPPGPHLKVLMVSGHCSPDEMVEMLRAGADDYLAKPFSIVQLRGRVQAALRLKDAQDRSEMLTRHLLAVNAELERNLYARDSDLVQARNALVLALAKLVAQRDTESRGHLRRMQRYCRRLAEEAARVGPCTDQIGEPFIELLECCAPLHDIGKVGLPDHILLKPGRLTSDERVLMQAHTILGAETLSEVARQHGAALAFLQMAIDIARHHHERYDGTGYPDRLAGSAIPLAARIVAVCDVYDALRSRRVYKPALSHGTTVQLMTEASAGQFDPALLQVFVRSAAEFERIFHEVTD
jgi:response regulator RpfG family c-di-GMP phosphodiesterase/serine/threonine protein kinase